MSSNVRLLVFVGLIAVLGGWFRGIPPQQNRYAHNTPSLPHVSSASKDLLLDRFERQIRPFFEEYCISCHGGTRQEGSLDLRGELLELPSGTDLLRWDPILQRLDGAEMPPPEATRHPSPQKRQEIITWIRDLQTRETNRLAGDPGPVLARRLSNAEYNYTIRDLIGSDIRPAHDFPVDPANESGFDNSGESLTMSPALLAKYLAAARKVVDHLILKPDGLVFANHPAATETDRDRYCVQRIVDFYDSHRVDLADYFQAAWMLHHREALRQQDTLVGLAQKRKLSPKYLALLWATLQETETVLGPRALVLKKWRALPAPQGAVEGNPNREPERLRRDCEALRDLVLRLRAVLKPNLGKLQVKGISAGSQPLVLWRNRELAARHQSYSGDVFSDLEKLKGQLKDADQGDRDLLHGVDFSSEDLRKWRQELERFCHIFPDAFVVVDRGPYFNPNDAGKGRPLTAGFHLMHGHFRDDAPLCDLILGDSERQKLDTLWQELNFVTLSPHRQYRDFIFFERAEPPRFLIDAEFDFARSEDRDATSPAKLARLEQGYLARAIQKGASAEALEAISVYFQEISREILHVEKARHAAEAVHQQALVEFACQAYRRPLTTQERDELVAYYFARRREDLSHEEAIRDSLITVLLSPHFCYRVTIPSPGPGPQPLSDYALASRLSYFLWSSMPDTELLEHAKAGDLHQPEVLQGQVRRMVADPKIRGLALEFAGNWLDIRRFEEHNAVDRTRFPQFTPELREAMLEEPIRYFLDVLQRQRSILDLLHGRDTFVNPPLARHYGMPIPPGGLRDWVHIEDAHSYGRGGLLPMAVFLTKNAPGLRTSPVKRGYWVVRRLLGEVIPPPPPTVPELPKDEAALGTLSLPEVLAQHRDHASCAGCHRRFDSLGLAFEGYGPVGERRSVDLGNRPILTRAVYPDGLERDALSGLQSYLKESRETDFLDNIIRKMYSYGLGRSLQLSDRPALEETRRRLIREGYSLRCLLEAVVLSPQFRNHQGEQKP